VLFIDEIHRLNPPWKKAIRVGFRAGLVIGDGRCATVRIELQPFRWLAEQAIWRLLTTPLREPFCIAYLRLQFYTEAS